MHTRLAQTARLIGALVIAYAVLALPSAYAAVCPLIISDKVTQVDQMTPVSGCEFGSVNIDTQDQVNADQMFGQSDWVLLGQTDYPQGHRKGQWALPDPDTFWQSYDSAMLVMQGGYNGGTPDYIGYLLSEPDGTQGHWITPTYLTMIGHISLYAHFADGAPEEVAPVPLPSALPLFLAALVGIGVVARRRTR